MPIDNTKPLYLNKSELIPQSLGEKSRRSVDICGHEETELAHIALSKQMAERDEEAMKLWAPYSAEIQSLSKQVSDIFKTNLSWPNPYFIPDDTVELILQSPWGDLEIEESVIEIEELIGKRISDKMWRDYSNKKYVELIQFLICEKRV